MPFEAAKAVAATFCHEIRYALTPIFGIDFLSLCTKPSEDTYKIMVIDRDIISECTETANRFRALSSSTLQARSPQTPSSNSLPRWSAKSSQRKLVKIDDAESRYGTDIDDSDMYLGSPQTPLTMEWTAMNTRRPARSRQYLPSSSWEHSAQSVMKGKKYHSSLDSERDQVEKRIMTEDEDYHREGSSTQSASSPKPQKRRKGSKARSKEARAAYTLLQLHMADARLGEGCK